jgi:hypothetical protein
MPVGMAESGAEMTVAGETEIQAQGRQVIVLTNQIERPGEPQPQLVTIQRHAFDPLEDLRKIDRRSANLCGNFVERPAPREITCKCQFYAIDQELALAACDVRGPRARWARTKARFSASSDSATPL